MSYYYLETSFQKGVGLSTGQGDDPTVMLQVSRDGGMTWGSELWKTLGKEGKYKTRAKWNRLGTSRNTVFKLKITDPVYRVLIGAVADIQECNL
jgi:hypothetical protein